MPNLSWKIAITGLVSLVTILLLFAFGGSQQQDNRSRFDGESSLPAGSVVNGDYFASGSVVEISGTVNGDVYAFGGQVLIDGQVNGDVLVAGGRIKISGRIAQDVRAAAGHITVTGAVGRNFTVAAGNVDLAAPAVVRGGLVAAGGNIDVSSPLGGDSRVAAGTLILASRVDGNVEAAVGTLRIASKADIRGNVNYWSAREAFVSEGARIQGKIDRRVPPRESDLWPAFVAGWIFLVAVSFVSTLILGLLSIRFLPAFHRTTVTILEERPWVSFAVGIVAVVVLPVFCALLFATALAIPLALILTAAFFILLYWSRIFAITRVGEAILRRFRPVVGQFSPFLAGLIVYYLLAIIPVIGWLVVILAVLFGLGAELSARKQFYVTAREQQLL